jgi:hypothetical protein
LHEIHHQVHGRDRLEREAELGTNPDDPDTDDDLLRDGFEVDNGFNPLVPGEAGQDPDGDGLSNLAESFVRDFAITADSRRASP